MCPSVGLPGASYFLSCNCLSSLSAWTLVSLFPCYLLRRGNCTTRKREVCVLGEVLLHLLLRHSQLGLTCSNLSHWCTACRLLPELHHVVCAALHFHSVTYPREGAVLLLFSSSLI